MLDAILRKFISDETQAGDRAARQRCGVLSGVVGIALNLLLFAGKLAAGLLAGAISVTADAFNNLSDAASSVVTLIAFKLAAAPAEETMMESSMPMATDSVWLMISGTTMRSRFCLEKIISSSPFCLWHSHRPQYSTCGHFVLGLFRKRTCPKHRFVVICLQGGDGCGLHHQCDTGTQSAAAHAS